MTKNPLKQSKWCSGTASKRKSVYKVRVHQQATYVRVLEVSLVKLAIELALRDALLLGDARCGRLALAPTIAHHVDRAPCYSHQSVEFLVPIEV